MHDGQVVQYGGTADTFRHPQTLKAAQVFSDPPINVASVTKTGTTITLGQSASWAATGDLADLADGTYQLAVRPHHVTPTATATNTVALSGRVLVTELSGSDSSAHFHLPRPIGYRCPTGVHPYEVGAEHPFYLNPAACLYFAPDGQFVSGKAA